MMQEIQMLSQLRWLFLAWALALVPRVAMPYTAPAAPLWGTYTSSSYYYTDYSYPKQQPQKPQGYVPKPQYCPETGRTVCKDVEKYPGEHIFDVLMNTKSRGFNFSSVFFDERDGDPEPNMEQLPDGPPRPPPPQHHDGYIVYQTSVHYNYHVPTNAPWYGSPPAQTTYTQGGVYVAPAQHGPAPPPQFVSQQHGSPPPHEQDFHRGKRGIHRRNQDSEEACAVRTTYVQPRAALNDQSSWKYVVNVPERDSRFRQVIRVDVCRSPNRPCSSQISLPFGYVSRCVQKYIKKNLLTLDMDGQGTAEEKIFVPSCCVCELVRDTNK